MSVDGLTKKLNPSVLLQKENSPIPFAMILLD